MSPNRQHVAGKQDLKCSSKKLAFLELSWLSWAADITWECPARLPRAEDLKGRAPSQGLMAMVSTCTWISNYKSRWRGYGFASNHTPASHSRHTGHLPVPQRSPIIFLSQNFHLIFSPWRRLAPGFSHSFIAGLFCHWDLKSGVTLLQRPLLTILLKCLLPPTHSLS